MQVDAPASWRTKEKWRDVDRVSRDAGFHPIPDNRSLLLGAPDLHSASKSLVFKFYLGREMACLRVVQSRAARTNRNSSRNGGTGERGAFSEKHAVSCACGNKTSTCGAPQIVFSRKRQGEKRKWAKSMMIVHGHITTLAVEGVPLWRLSRTIMHECYI